MNRRPVPLTAPLLVAAAVYTVGGGVVHLREWLDLYRDIPAAIAGSAVVRIGFPANTVLSVGIAVLLLVVARRGGRLLPFAVAGALLFQAGSLAALVVSRTGSLLGWTEATWAGGASQVLLTEVGALVMLLAASAITAAEAVRRRPSLATLST